MKLRPRTLSALGMVAALLAAVPSAYAQQRDPKLDHVLQRAHGGSLQRVIVRFKPGAESSIEKNVLARGSRIFGKHPSIGAITAELRADDLAAFVRNPDVESVAIDADVTADATYDYSSTIATSLLRSTLAESSSSTGSGVGVAVIDSGIAPLSAFTGRITAFYDVTTGVPIPTSANDQYGHGTHVAGLIGADDDNYMGVAPSVTFVGLKVLDKNGRGSTSSVIAAIEFAVANRTRFNIRVINLSLGHPILSPAADDPLVQAVESAVRAGLIVVVSAGNIGTSPTTGVIGYAGITSPGNAPSAITVGAVNTQGTVTHNDDDVAPYSSRGPTWFDGFVKPDVVAPGHALISTTDVNSYLYKTYPNYDITTNYKRYLKLSGSSMATAVTTGVVAAAIESRRKAISDFGVSPGRLTASTMKAMLQYTALPIRRADGTKPDLLTQGTGEVNADGVVRLAWLGVAIWANSATATWYPQLLQTKTTIAGSTIAWAGKITWGQRLLSGAGLAVTNAVWASNVVWGDNIVWGENVVWGDNIVWGENVVWGDNIVWGENLVWGENIVWGESLGTVGW